MKKVMDFFGMNRKAGESAEITTSLHCSAESYDDEYDSNFESVPSRTESDFEFIYDIVRRKIEIAKSSHPNVKIDITLIGKLNDENIKETFHDIEQYHQFLQYSLLIDTKSNPDFVTAIKLLKQFKMVDCPDNQDITHDMQTMIKRELLSLPEICKGLAWYSNMYNQHHRDGEVAIGYKCEALDILREGIPALKTLTLTGTRRGFITA